MMITTGCLKIIALFLSLSLSLSSEPIRLPFIKKLAIYIFI